MRTLPSPANPFIGAAVILHPNFYPCFAVIFSKILILAEATKG